MYHISETRYIYTNNLSQLLKSLKHSRSNKEKKGWVRAGTGFIEDEIKEISFNPLDHKITVITPGMALTQISGDYNLRETDIMISWVEKEMLRQKLKSREEVP